MLRTLLAVAVAGAAVLALPTPAQADSTMLCNGYAACSTGGYSTHAYPAHLNTSYWGQYAGVNCTNYAAFVMSTVFHAATPNYRLGNGSQWAASASAHAVPVNGTPSVGSVAQWDAYATGMGAAGHVAIVERVGPNNSYVDISQDSIGSDTNQYDWRRIYAHTTGWQSWPSHFIHFAIPNVIGEGSFLRYGTRVYVVAGGSPEYVSTWASVGGTHPTITVTAAQFAALLPLPRNGSFVRDIVGNKVYEIAGGAPLYITDWSTVGGMHSTVTIDGAAVTHTGQAAPWNHLTTVPLDATFVRDTVANKVYEIAGSAPLYVTDWSTVGGMHPTVTIDGAAVANAGQPAPWNHLRAVPIDRTYLRDTVHNKVYKVVAGAPFWLSSWATEGGPQPTVTIDPWDLANRTNLAAHLRAAPPDGTTVSALPSDAGWTFTGGCYASATAQANDPTVPDSGLADYSACGP